MPTPRPRNRRALLTALALAAVPALSAASAAAQPRVVGGVVVDSAGVGIAVARVTLRAGQDSATTTTAEGGTFRVRWPGAARVGVLRVTRLGFAPAELRVDAAADARPLRVVLGTVAASVAGVVVRSQTAAERLREGPLTTAVVDARDATIQTRSTADVLDRVAGVRVRQSGGEGSTALLSIHGLSGSQIRTFVDGVPQDFLGPAGQLTGLSTAALARVEVYKGAVPVELGGDALGGALNFVTDVRAGRRGEVTLGVGSYGRVAAGVALRHAGRRWSAGLTAGHRAARNDYPVDVTTVDANNQPVPLRTRRFHDGFRVSSASGDAALHGRRWADTLRLRLFGARDARQLQHAPIMAQPYGAATLDGTARGGVAAWSLARPRARLAAEGGYSVVGSRFVDTTLNVYDWSGAVIRRRDYGGEISSSRNLLSLDTRNTLGRVTAAVPAAGGTLRAHALYLGFRRDGRDSVAAAYYGEDPFRAPSTLARAVVGVAYEAELSNGLRVDAAAKYFRYAAEGWAVERGVFAPAAPQRRGRAGALAAASWRLPRGFTAKGSYELATRLPDVHEVLGDFALVRPNPALRPERSHNVNAGVLWAHGAARVEATGFLRRTHDIVFLQTSQFYALYQNLLQARTAGAELSVSARPASFLSIDASATYQDIRNRSPKGASTTVADRYFGARLPNVPSVFANAQLTARRSRTQAWWGAGYVRPFFLYWEVDGLRDSKAVIPEQLVQHVGVSHDLRAARVQVTAEVQNLFDARAFDVFSVPRPGRALQVQARAALW